MEDSIVPLGLGVASTGLALLISGGILPSDIVLLGSILIYKKFIVIQKFWLRVFFELSESLFGLGVAGTSEVLEIVDLLGRVSLTVYSVLEIVDISSALEISGKSIRKRQEFYYFYFE